MRHPGLPEAGRARRPRFARPAPPPPAGRVPPRTPPRQRRRSEQLPRACGERRARDADQADEAEAVSMAPRCPGTTPRGPGRRSSLAAASPRRPAPAARRPRARSSSACGGRRLHLVEPMALGHGGVDRRHGRLRAPCSRGRAWWTRPAPRATTRAVCPILDVRAVVVLRALDRRARGAREPGARLPTAPTGPTTTRSLLLVWEGSSSSLTSARPRAARRGCTGHRMDAAGIQRARSEPA